MTKTIVRKKPQVDILRFFGAWADRDDECRRIFDDIARERKKAKLRDHS